MRVTKPGNKGPRKVLTATCSRCNAEVEATREELNNLRNAQYITTYTETPYYRVECPECEDSKLCFYDEIDMD